MSRVTDGVGRKPAGWRPPYPSWSSSFGDQSAPALFGYLGCQFDDGGPAAAAFRAWWSRAADLIDGPAHHEWASYGDAGGRRNIVVLCYWLDAAAHDRWWLHPEVGGWWGDHAREQEDAGYWREMNVVAPGRFETLFSSPNPAGLAVAGTGFIGEVNEHGYWGSMRDRLPASGHDAFSGSLAALAPASARIPAARRQLSLPQNLAMIRSGQDWRACGDAERGYYLRDVHPVLIEGMNFLRDNGEATGCLSCRFMTSDGEGYAGQVTFGAALFRDLADLEAWAEKHPTHVAIFGAFLGMVKAFNGALDLRLWHEVVIVDGPASTYEYINCTPATGALRWLAANDDA